MIIAIIMSIVICVAIYVWIADLVVSVAAIHQVTIIASDIVASIIIVLSLPPCFSCCHSHHSFACYHCQFYCQFCIIV